MPSVFISYSHDSGAHVQRVVALADELRKGGIDVRLDQYVGHPSEGWPRWMERQVVDSDFVLLVCTAAYCRRYNREEQPGVGNGAAWEALIAQQLHYEGGGRNDKLIPIVLDGSTPEDIPISLRPYTYYRLPASYDDLYRRLTGQAKTPPLGEVRRLPPTPRSSFFDRMRINNEGATIGSMVMVDGNATIGPTTINMPSVPAPQPRVQAPARRSVLLCTANASHPDERLRLEEELRAIREALRRSRLRDRYGIEVSPAVNFPRLVHDLSDHSPVFVHFGGHGDESGDLILKGHDGDEAHVPPAQLAELFAAMKSRPTLVTFAVCHSAALAQAVAAHADYCIGFDGWLDDLSAPLFSATLYERLASVEDVDVPQAFNLARIACLASGHASVGLARLYDRRRCEVDVGTARCKRS